MLKTKNLKKSNLSLSLICLVILTIFTSLMEVLLYLLFGTIIDQLTLAIKQPNSKSYFDLDPLTTFISLSLIQMLIGILLLMVFQPLKSLLLQKASYSYLMRVRKRFFDEVNSLDYIGSYTQLTNPSLLSIILNDSTAYANGMISYHIELLTSITTTIFALFSFYLYHWSLAAIVFAALILSSLISFFFDKKVKKVNQEYSDANSKVAESATQLLSSYEPIFLLGKKNYFRDQMLNALSARFKAQSRQLSIRQRLSLTLGKTAHSLLFITTFGIILLTAWDPESGINIGASISTFAIFGSLNSRFNSIFSTLLSLRGLKIFRDKLTIKKEEVNPKSENAQDVEQQKLTNLNPKTFKFESIEIDKLSLNIEGKEIFKDLKLTFKAGKKYAIVGPSGIGKSSLTKLIGGLIVNYSGEIKLNGQDYNNLPDRFLNKLISLNEGDNLLFEGTIAQNITLWQSEDVEESLEFANLRLAPLGLTKHSSALSLSEGERQRVTIARNHYESKPIMIFDESLANLDKKNVKKIRENIALDKTRCYIFVSHHIDKNDDFFDQIIDLNELIKPLK